MGVKMRTKTKNFLLWAFVAFVFTVTSCEKSSNNPQPEPNYNYNGIMDTLKDDWTWVKTYTPKHGIIDNEFKSILKVLSQSEDSSINYEVFVEDTLFHKSNFQLQQVKWYQNGNVANIKFPHYLPEGGDLNWAIFVGNMLTLKPSKDTLTFWDGAVDGYIYFYKRIK